MSDQDDRNQESTGRLLRLVPRGTARGLDSHTVLDPENSGFCFDTEHLDPSTTDCPVDCQEHATCREPAMGISPGRLSHQDQLIVDAMAAGVTESPSDGVAEVQAAIDSAEFLQAFALDILVGELPMTAHRRAALQLLLQQERLIASLEEDLDFEQRSW